MDAHPLAPASAMHWPALQLSEESAPGSDMQNLAEAPLAKCGADIGPTDLSSSPGADIAQGWQAATRKPPALVKRVQCDVCWAWLARRDIFLRHKRVLHSGVGGRFRYRCSYCSKAFARNDNLKRHVHMVHWAEAALAISTDLDPASLNTVPAPAELLPDAGLEAARGAHIQLSDGGSRFGSSPTDRGASSLPSLLPHYAASIQSPGQSVGERSPNCLINPPSHSQPDSIPTQPWPPDRPLLNGNGMVELDTERRCHRTTQKNLSFSELAS
ncbi:hypothetical protein DL767_000733 [Monosporascus sp. MG133]|nr:hypothetical protein DL767_000733 [Monosporascus sp. MG133]